MRIIIFLMRVATYSFIFISCVSGHELGLILMFKRCVCSSNGQDVGEKKGIACHFDDSCISYLSSLVCNCFTFLMFLTLVIISKVGNLASKRGQQTGMESGINLMMKVCCKIYI